MRKTPSVTQFKVPGSNEAMVMLKASDYQKLLDTLEKAQKMRNSKLIRQLVSAGVSDFDNKYPTEISTQLANGVNPIKVHREHLGLKQKDLADEVGVAASTISQLETGQRVGTFKTLKKIAKVLGVPLEDLSA